MSNLKITTKGFKELEKAIRNNPKEVTVQGRLFLNRGVMAYRRVIEGSPWRVGQSGGGVPVDTKDLKRSHTYKVQGLRGIVSFDANPNPSRSNAPYGVYVHEGTPKGQMKARPWLNYAVLTADSEVERLYRSFLDKIINKLSS